MRVGTTAKPSEYHVAIGLASLDRRPEVKRGYRAMSDLH